MRTAGLISKMLPRCAARSTKQFVRPIATTLHAPAGSNSNPFEFIVQCKTELLSLGIDQHHCEEMVLAYPALLRNDWSDKIAELRKLFLETVGMTEVHMTQLFVEAPMVLRTDLEKTRQCVLALIEDGVPPEDLPYLLVDSLASAESQSMDATVSNRVVKDCQSTIAKLFRNHVVEVGDNADAAELSEEKNVNALTAEKADTSAAIVVAILKNACPKMLSPAMLSSEVVPKISLLLESMTQLKLSVTESELVKFPKYFGAEESFVRMRTSFASTRVGSLTDSFCLADLLATTDAEFCGLLKCPRVDWDKYLIEQADLME